MKDMRKVWLYRGKVYCTLKGQTGNFVVNIKGVTRVGYE